MVLQVLANPIKNLRDLSIKFPKYIIALLKPLFKKGSKLDAKNYRPISLLPLLSKILENVVQNVAQWLRAPKLFRQIC